MQGRIVFCLFLLAVLIAKQTQAQFIPGSIVCLSNGHCYQSVSVVTCTRYDWGAVSRFSLTSKYGGLAGHLLTIETADEWNIGFGSNDNYLGARGENNGPYVWVVGPSAGTPVDFFGAPFYPGSGGCAPFTALTGNMNPIQYWGVSPIGAGTRTSCGNGSCFVGETFKIEYEPDTVPPHSEVTSPNGGEILAIGASISCNWVGSDAFGSLDSLDGIDIHLSRSGPGGPFEEIVVGLPPGGDGGQGVVITTGTIAMQVAGSYEWVVSGPPTSNAFLRVTVRDEAGNTTSDLSDGPFVISLPSTSTPSITAPYSVLAVEGDSISIAATATDPDAGEILGISVAGAPSSLAFSSTPGPHPVTGTLSGRLTYYDSGVSSIVWSVTDGTWASNWTTTLTVMSSLPPELAGCFRLPTDLVSWWAAEGNADDLSNGHHGALQGDASFAAGIVGQAFEFDGVGDYVTVPDHTDWDLGAGDFTIDLWVRFDQIKPSMFIHQQSGANAGGFEFDYQPPSGMLVFSCNGVIGGIGRAWAPQANTWHHLAVTRSGGTFRLYANGSQLGSELFDPNPVADVTGILRIGSWAPSTEYDIDGRIDDLDVFHRALLSEEIAAIFAAGIAGSCRTVTSVAVPKPSSTPVGLRLGPAVPNPSKHEVRLSLSLPRAGRVVLSIHDVLGKRVASIVNQDLPAGARLVSWNGQNSAGQPVASGIYFALVESSGEAQIRKLVIAR